MNMENSAGGGGRRERREADGKHSKSKNPTCWEPRICISQIWIQKCSSNYSTLKISILKLLLSPVAVEPHPSPSVASESRSCPPAVRHASDAPVEGPENQRGERGGAKECFYSNSGCISVES